MTFSIDDLEQLLIKKWEYEPYNAKKTAEKILKMDTYLLKAFVDYLEKGEYLEDFRLFGLSFEDIGSTYQFKPPAVFLFFDWLIREPVEALDALVDEFKRPLPDSFKHSELKAYLVKQRMEST